MKIFYMTAGGKVNAAGRGPVPYILYFSMATNNQDGDWGASTMLPRKLPYH